MSAVVNRRLSQPNEMTVHGTFGNLIYSVVYIGCTLLFLLPELVICLEYLEDGEKQVSDLALNLNELPYRRFEVLKPSMDCKFSNLTRCHVNPDKFYDYQERCFKYLCQHTEQYRCLNGPKNRTIHICLPLEECQKRSRDIATYETAGSGHVNVYRIDCPAGYFQSSLRNCFDKCDKDESLVIVINATGQKPAIGYCNSQKGYCNRKNVFMFEVGSTEDECIHAKLDMKIQCDAEEELLPNCSCVYKCQRGEKRDWSEAFMCRSTGTSVRNHVSTEDVTEVPTTASQQTSYQTSQKVITGMHILDDELSVKDDMKQNTDDLQSSKTIVTVGAELIGVIAGMCAFASIVVGLVMYYKYRHQGRGTTTRHVRRSKVDNRRIVNLNAKTIDTQCELIAPLAEKLQAVSEDITNSAYSPEQMEHIQCLDEGGISSDDQTAVKAIFEK